MIGERKQQMVLTPETNFKTLCSSFSSFKNPFLLEFGQEFRNKVIKNMTPTLLLILDQSNPPVVEEFLRVSAEFKNNMHITIITLEELNQSQRQIYQELERILGESSFTFPFIVFIEPNIDTMRFSQYRYNNKNLKQLKQFLEQLFKGQVSPYIKNQPLKKDRLGELTYLNSDSYKSQVHNDEQESVVFVHEGEDKPFTQNVVQFLQKLSKAQKYSALKFFLVDSHLNEIPVFFEKTPVILIYSQNNWEFPLTYYDLHSNKNFIDLLDKRRELISKPSKNFDFENMDNIMEEGL